MRWHYSRMNYPQVVFAATILNLSPFHNLSSGSLPNVDNPSNDTTELIGSMIRSSSSTIKKSSRTAQKRGARDRLDVCLVPLDENCHKEVSRHAHEETSFIEFDKIRDNRPIISSILKGKFKEAAAILEKAPHLLKTKFPFVGEFPIEYVCPECLEPDCSSRGCFGPFIGGHERVKLNNLLFFTVSVLGKLQREKKKITRATVQGVVQIIERLDKKNFENIILPSQSKNRRYLVFIEPVVRCLVKFDDPILKPVEEAITKRMKRGLGTHVMRSRLHGYRAILDHHIAVE